MYVIIKVGSGTRSGRNKSGPVRVASSRVGDKIGSVGSVHSRFASLRTVPLSHRYPLLFHVHANNPRADSFAWWNAQLGPNVGYSNINSSNSNIINVNNDNRDIYYTSGRDLTA